jgi:peptidoglycan/xylan/chitin deacetylase (PgdA/CDA1 family)
VTVTFDDGYADNLLAAAPLLERHGVPATVFVTSGMVGARHEFWWDEVERIAFSPRTLEPPVPWVPMSWRDADGAPVPRPGPGWLIGASETPTSRHRLFRSLIGALRPLSAPERRRRLEVLRSWAGVSEAARDSHRALSADELRALARRPGITVGSHTVTHPQLSAQPPAAQRAELTESRRALQAALERPVRAVAYPFGTRLDVSTTSRRAARDAGYDVAFSTEAGVAWRWSDRAWMPRCVVLDWEADEFTERLERWLG